MVGVARDSGSLALILLCPVAPLPSMGGIPSTTAESQTPFEQASFLSVSSAGDGELECLQVDRPCRATPRPTSSHALPA